MAPYPGRNGIPEMKRLLQACAAVLALTLAGCATPIIETTGPLAIREVQITAAPTMRSETDILPLVRQTVEAQLIDSRPGEVTRLDITLTELHYKNPIASLLVADANRLSATIIAFNTSGAEIARFEAIAVDQIALNGIAGAAIAVGQDRARVDRALARGIAESIEARIYGRRTKPAITPELGQPNAPAPSATAPARPASSQTRAPSGAGV